MGIPMRVDGSSRNYVVALGAAERTRLAGPDSVAEVHNPRRARDPTVVSSTFADRAASFGTEARPRGERPAPLYPALRRRGDALAMLFTSTTPARQGDRILLYLDPDRARDDARDGQTIFEVAVGLDASGGRLTSVGLADERGGADWATPAYFE